MSNLTLFEQGGHRNVLLEDFGRGQMVQANQHLIIHDGQGLLLDPGGHKVYPQASLQAACELRGGRLRYLFFSHQDPDVLAAANGWLMTTDAEAYISALWLRFVPHFGLDSVAAERLRPIPDEGLRLELGGAPLLLLPAHFLHSQGNFQVYDPTARVLYTGDLGASLGQDYREVGSFDDHVPYMLGFHRRYMASGRVLAAWAAMVRTLDVELIAPQHGAFFRGRELVRRFVDWCEGLECGIDLMLGGYRVPGA